jgi:hypothetical protein
MAEYILTIFVSSKILQFSSVSLHFLTTMLCTNIILAGLAAIVTASTTPVKNATDALAPWEITYFSARKYSPKSHVAWINMGTLFFPNSRRTATGRGIGLRILSPSISKQSARPSKLTAFTAIWPWNSNGMANTNLLLVTWMLRSLSLGLWLSLPLIILAFGKARSSSEVATIYIWAAVRRVDAAGICREGLF